MVPLHTCTILLYIRALDAQHTTDQFKQHAKPCHHVPVRQTRMRHRPNHIFQEMKTVSGEKNRPARNNNHGEMNPHFSHQRQIQFPSAKTYIETKQPTRHPL